MRYPRIATLALLSLALAFAAKKKNPDDVTQTLAEPKDPPMVALGETRRLVFHVSPLSAKGLLSQQTRDALKAILKATGGAPMVHVRAFVAGSGDPRRVPQIVSEVFSEKKMPLPSVSVVQVGGLPLENAQIVLETVSMGKKDVNSDGLTFVEAQRADSVAKSLDQVASRLAGEAPLRVTCFVSEIGGDAGTIAARFPSASVNVVQTQRAPLKSGAACEAVARGVVATVPKLAFTGTRVAFGGDEKAAALAFERLDRDLRGAGVDPADMIATHIYPLSPRLGELALKVRAAKSGATVVPVEGVASVDGSFAIDAVAAAK
jgi:enamine deaminase RidA (YjgF/YER057c/UK114 family)